VLSAVLRNRSVRDIIPDLIDPRRQPLVSGFFIDFPSIRGRWVDVSKTTSRPLQEAARRVVRENLRRYANGEPMLSVVDPERGY
jgi:hypothetical protein